MGVTWVMQEREVTYSMEGLNTVEDILDCRGVGRGVGQVSCGKHTAPSLAGTHGKAGSGSC